MGLGTLSTFASDDRCCVTDRWTHKMCAFDPTRTMRNISAISPHEPQFPNGMQLLSVLELLGTTISTLRCKIMPTNVLPSNTPSYMHWHRWFAWRPVIIYGRAGRSRVVWLQYVERIWTEDIISGLGPRWIYRRVWTDDG
jgi:hypothetical protein